MKKIILVATLGLFSLTACKKDYTCECTSTRTETETTNGNVDVTTSTDANSYTVKDIKKKAYNNQGGCVSTENSYTYSYGSGSNATNVSVVENSVCTLKK